MRSVMPEKRDQSRFFGHYRLRPVRRTLNFRLKIKTSGNAVSYVCNMP